MLLIFIKIFFARYGIDNAKTINNMIEKTWLVPKKTKGILSSYMYSYNLFFMFEINYDLYNQKYEKNVFGI